MSFQQAIVFWLRFLAVLPGAVVALLVAAFPIHWLNMLWHSAAEGENLLAIIEEEQLERLMYALFFPMIFVIAGAWIAPTGKTLVAAALAIFWPIVVIGSVFYVMSSDLYNAEFNWFVVAISAALGVAGLICAGSYVQKEWGHVEPRPASNGLYTSPPRPVDPHSRDYLVWWLMQKGLMSRDAEFEADARQREAESVLASDDTPAGWERARSVLYDERMSPR